jgi:hypothetical protein
LSSLARRTRFNGSKNGAVVATFTIFARQDSTTAANDSLNPIGNSGTPATVLTFTDNNGTGDLSLEYNGGLPDPDTQVIIGGTTYNFTVLLTGVLPLPGDNNQQVPPSLAGRTVAVIQITLANGQVREYFFVLGQPPATALQMAGFGGGAIPLTGENFEPPPFCVAHGTRIETPHGPCPVESLGAGDIVVTEDGRAVPIAWIGASRYECDRAAREDRLRPVCLRAHAFGPGLPDRDLVMSPQHRVVVEGPTCELLFGMDRAFVCARHLPDHLASRPDPEDDVIYFHILLEDHEIILANGLPCESLQPARRMVEAMSETAQASLMAVLDVLGLDAMLARPDALSTLNHREARVLLADVAVADLSSSEEATSTVALH